LDRLNKLYKLSLRSNQIAEIRNLGHLKHLNLLSLNHNNISKIEGIEQLSQLTGLYLEYNQISKIEGVNHLKKLTQLDLSHNQITVIEGLDDLKLLESLNLSNNYITDISGLEMLRCLKRLHIRNNKISGDIINKLGGNIENMVYYPQNFVEFSQRKLNDGEKDVKKWLTKLAYELKKKHQNTPKIKFEMKSVLSQLDKHDIYVLFGIVRYLKNNKQNKMSIDTVFEQYKFVCNLHSIKPKVKMGIHPHIRRFKRLNIITLNAIYLPVL